jgi:hypothetical protein
MKDAGALKYLTSEITWTLRQELECSMQLTTDRHHHLRSRALHQRSSHHANFFQQTSMTAISMRNLKKCFKKTAETPKKTVDTGNSDGHLTVRGIQRRKQKNSEQRRGDVKVLRGHETKWQLQMQWWTQPTVFIVGRGAT